MLDSVALVIGRKESKGLEKFNTFIDPGTGDLLDKETELEMSGLLPTLRPGVETELARHGKNNTWIFINMRPVEFKEAEKMLKETFMSVCGLESSKFPVCVINISIGGNMRENVDPNLEPNKQKVGLACKQVVMDGLTKILNKHWGIEDAIKEEKENMHTNLNSPAEVVKNKSDFESDGEDEPVVKEPLFNHIGLTQDNSQATSKITASKFIENSYGLSQYFGSSEKSITSDSKAKPIKVDDKSLEESYDDGSSSASKIYHSPILKPDMFKDLALPGVDAVYVSRLRDGDFPEIPDEELHDVSVREETGGDQLRNPFIQFECQEEFQDNTSESDMDFSTITNSSRSEALPTLKLKQPKFDKIYKSTPNKRKREDSSLVRIDSFLSNHSRQNAPRAKSNKRSTSPTEIKKKKFLPRTRISVTFNIDKCAAPVDDEIAPEKNLELIGSLSSSTTSMWAAKRGQELFAIHPPTLREIILKERLMRHHKMPTQRLSDPMSLADDLLPSDLVETVLQLKMSSTEDKLITDERIALNGFLLSASVDQNSTLSRIQVLSSCNLIRDYGIDDLVGILSLIKENKNISVCASRPTKVSQYLYKEANRLAQEMPNTFDKESTYLQLQSFNELFGDHFESDGKGIQKLRVL